MDDVKERIVRLEVMSTSVHADFDRLHADLKSLETALDNHGKDEALTFQEINKALVTLSSTVREISVSITDLRDTVKDLKENQSLMYKDIVILQGFAQTVDDMKKKIGALEQSKQEFDNYKTAGKASWKTITIIGAIVSFIWSCVLFALKVAFGI